MKREIERNLHSLRGNLGMRFDRRKAILGSSALTLGLGTAAIASNTIPEDAKEKSKPGPGANVGPREAEFSRDYEPPAFKPSWKAPQLNRTLVQDFVIFAHSDLKMVEKLLEREPKLINSAMDWGNGDFETALGGASHMGRKEIVRFLLSKGARIDIFCAAMMGMLEVVQAMLTLEPKLIDVPGPHGFNLHFHAQVGQKDAVTVLEYLQSVKELKLRPVPFLNKKNENK